ncbi:MAG: putative beta-barrel porin-2, OmpL-like, partial [Verrucomicrobiota bacterium]
YVGATLNTPVAGLKVGAAFDHVGNFGGLDNEVTVVGGYASYQATQKLSVHGRYEYVCVNPANQANGGDEAQSVTATVQYDLWQNVVSRLEARWDHTETVGSSAAFTSDFHSKGDYVSFYANIIYKF